MNPISPRPPQSATPPTPATPKPQTVRIRAVALPAEHGGWSFLFEPVALGLLVAPSPAGLSFGVGMTFAFLARHPLKLVLGDRRRGKRLRRTSAAQRFALIYGVLSAAAFVIALLLAGFEPFLPLIIALPLFVLQIQFDALAQSRALTAELIGTVALGVSAVSIALAGGWSPRDAALLWAIVAARGLPSVLYVRSRLRLERNQPINRPLTILAHVAALLVIVALGWTTSIPALAAVAVAFLLVRAVYGLSAYRSGGTAKQIGVQEVIVGVVFVGIVALGYALGA